MLLPRNVKTPSPEPILRATLTEPPQRRADLRNVSPLWVGNALLPGGQKPRLWMRKLSPPELLAECYVTVAGRMWGLQIPRPLLVLDPMHLLTAPGDPPLFGSQDAAHPSLRQRIAAVGDAAVRADLMRWPGLRQCGCFDEHIANPDRNLGNVLFDGDADWVPIDQAHAFGGPTRWPTAPLSPDELVLNQLLNELLSRATETDTEARTLVELAGDHTTVAAGTGWDTVLDADTVALVHGTRLYPAIVEFMAARLPKLPRLVHDRAAHFMPQQTLAL